MPLDPQVQAFLEQAAALGLPPMHTLTPAEARAQAAARQGAAPVEAVAKVEDRLIPGTGADVPIRVYTPAGDAPFPALLFFHGGGWVIGSVAGSDGTARALANRTGCVVVSVDYRLAPEHSFPAAADDCYDATAWVADNAATIGVDANRIAVSGISAGGNLAAVVALMARDRGGPAIVHQLLVVPATDYDFTRESYTSNGQGYGLTRDAVAWFWDQYVANDADRLHPYAAPMRASDLRDLPSATVITAEFDPLRDEGQAYAMRLGDAGVSVSYTNYAGMVHGSFSMFAVIDIGRRALDQASTAVRAAVSGRPVGASGG
ncbi:MAG: alpha/beta hydrolase [Dehalococcoidia bacterium]